MALAYHKVHVVRELSGKGRMIAHERQFAVIAGLEGTPMRTPQVRVGPDPIAEGGRTG
jgi:hypothetical protein